MISYNSLVENELEMDNSFVRTKQQ